MDASSSFVNYRILRGRVVFIMFLFTACLSSEFACNDTGTCIPGYLTRDGLADCDDSSDERKWLFLWFILV